MELFSQVEFGEPGYVNLTFPSENHSSDVRKFMPLINLIAVYYQIRDDYMNLLSKEVGHVTLMKSCFAHLDIWAALHSTSRRKAGRTISLRASSRSPSFTEFVRTLQTIF